MICVVVKVSGSLVFEKSDLCEDFGDNYLFTEKMFENNVRFNSTGEIDTVEETWVYVNRTKLMKTHSDISEDGLFSKKNIPSGQIISVFGGIILSKELWENKRLIDPSYFRIFDHPSRTRQLVVYIPDKVGEKIDLYSRTLGHKINHAFPKKANCEFEVLYQSTFGYIPTAKSTKYIHKDEEILCPYELPYHDAPEWYKEQWREDVDKDWIFEPLGPREVQRNEGDHIMPFLADEGLYKRFYVHATKKLKLMPTT